MKALFSSLFLASVFVLAGCVSPRTIDSYSAADRRTASTPAPDSAPSTGGRTRSEAAAVARPEERPGLGTSWGETRESRVGATSFVRSHFSSPNGIGKLFYNDRAGVEAMTATFGGATRVSPPMRIPGGLISLWLKDASGRWLSGYGAGGDGFVIGEKGDRYEIFVRNESRARVEVVASVDGLDVMDGKPASLRKRGYVLEPGDSLEIDGFRTGFESVAAFRFGAVSDSYSALKHGTTRNVGVIGAAVYVEKGVDPWATEPWRRREANPFPGRKWATGP